MRNFFFLFSTFLNISFCYIVLFICLFVICLYLDLFSSTNLILNPQSSPRLSTQIQPLSQPITKRSSGEFNNTLLLDKKRMSGNLNDFNSTTNVTNGEKKRLSLNELGCK
jgi:hypothetical protein